MSINITQFKASITPKLHGASLAKIAGLYEKMREAASNMRLRVYPPTLIRSAAIQNAIYDRVYNYTCQDDCDSQSIIDIRPIGERSRQDANIPAGGIKSFDIKKAENTYTIEQINGVKTLRLSKCLMPRTILNRCDSLSDGTIVASGDASNLSVDYLDHVSGEAALKFDLSGATGTGVITFTLAGPVDLTKLLNLGALFEWFKFPVASGLTSVKLRWGTDGSNYWEKTVTAAQDRAFADNAWMLLNHQWNSATKVGTPSEGAIVHLEVIVSYVSGTPRTGVGLDNITAALGQAWETVYYSSAFFTDITGATHKQIPSTDSDIILLEDDALAIFTYEFMLTLQQELKGKNMASDFAFFRSQLYGLQKNGETITEGLYELYGDKYPSQIPPRQETYYGFDPLDGYGDSGTGFDDD